jgi:glucokinase
MNSNIEQKFIGIEIGGTKLQLVSGDSCATILQSIRYSVDPSKGAVNIREKIQEGIEKLFFDNYIDAIGVGFGGPVDWKTGTIQLSHQVEGWANFNIVNWLHNITGKPIWVDNDANIAALAEAKHGSGKGYNNVFYITIGSGIGGGMVINQKIYHGRIPGEAEIGHLRLDKNGITLESKCSGWAVNKKVREYIQLNPSGRLAQLAVNKPIPEAALLKPALEEHDLAANQIINEIADDISFALSHVVHLFHPDIIVIGGGLSLLGDHLKFPVKERLPSYLMKAFLPSPDIEIAALGENVVPVGALELAKTAFIDSLKSKRINSD